MTTVRKGVILTALLAAALIGCDDSSDRSSATRDQSSGQPAASSAEQSPAKAAALGWARAVAAGDVATAKSFAVGDALGMKALEALVAMTVSDSKLQTTLKEKFGAADQTLATKFVVLVEYSTESISGDTATLTPTVAAAPLQLKKQPDGSWKVDLNKDPVDTLTRGVAVFTELARVNNEVAAAAAAGKYQNLDEARDALAAKLGPSGPLAGASTGSDASGQQAPAVATLDDSPLTPVVNAAIDWAAAVSAGSLKGAKSASVGDKAGIDVLEAIIAMVQSEEKLEAAIKDKFGAAEPTFSNTLITLLSESTERVFDDTAILMPRSGAETFQLKKQPDGSWKMDLNKDPADKLARDAAMYRAKTRLIDEVTAATVAGKYQRIEDLRAALAGKSDPSAAPPATPAAAGATPPPAPAPAGGGLD